LATHEFVREFFNCVTWSRPSPTGRAQKILEYDARPLVTQESPNTKGLSMRLVINAFKAALVVLCSALAVCAVSEASAAGPGSASGTVIPTATYIIDGKGHMWTVSGGVICQDGALAGYSNAVKKLVYDNNIVYQENTAGGWWSWNGNTWIACGDPFASPDGTSVPRAVQIIDSGGNVWTLAGGVIYENGALAGYSNAVTKLRYNNNTVYQQNAAGGWWSWNGRTWVSSADPLSSPDGTSVPGAAHIIDGAENVWTVAAGVIHKNGVLAGYSNAVTKLLYHNYTIFQQNAAGGWWSWNGNSWVSSGDPTASAAAGGSLSATSAGLLWTAPTQNTDGTLLTDLAGFTIYYGTDLGALQSVQLADPGATSYVISNLSTGLYYFAVAAYTAAGIESVQSAMSSKTIP
jgi:hypothetical protein